MGVTTGPRSLSIAIVCKDNEGTIGRTLESVAGLVREGVREGGEIVAVDSGSADGTIGLLERYGARVIRSAWMGYVKTKQLALESCLGEWVLMVDTDESVDAELATAIREAVSQADAGVGGYAMNRKVYYQDRALNHAWQPEWRLRLVRRAVGGVGVGGARVTGVDPHDVVMASPGTRVERLRGTLRHDSIGTFAEFFAKQARHGAEMARSLHEAGERGSHARLVVSPIAAVLKQLVLKSAWRDGYAGWLAAAAAGVGAAVKHGVLVEMGRAETSDRTHR